MASSAWDWKQKGWKQSTHVINWFSLRIMGPSHARRKCVVPNVTAGIHSKRPKKIRLHVRLDGLAGAVGALANGNHGIRFRLQ